MKPKDTSAHYLLSSSPHAHAKISVRRMMLDVIIALVPALACALWFFGLPALWLVVTCVASAVATEAVCRKLMGRQQTIGDLSAVLTGLLLAFNLPPTLPLWMAAVGSAFAITIAKQVFGGLGYNPFNPALAARAFMLISFTGAMTTWTPSGWIAGIGANGVDAVTSATPLSMLTKGVPHEMANSLLAKTLFVGNVNGCVGEVSSLALLVGAAYLLFRKVITWHVPVSFLGAMFAFAFFKYGANAEALKFAELHVFAGGAILGACFMATDYVTSPITAKGKLIFGAGCGLLTMLIRLAPAYPEGTSFAILTMNAICPLINRWTQPKPFGRK